MAALKLFFLFIGSLAAFRAVDASLFPQNSALREVTTLDGIWDFRLTPPNDPRAGEREQWFNCANQDGKVYLKI
jgi:hypothetical protein